MKRKRMEIFESVLEAIPREIEDEALADVMDALSWHPYVGFNLKDAAGVLTLAGRADLARKLARREPIGVLRRPDPVEDPHFRLNCAPSISL